MSGAWIGDFGIESVGGPPGWGTTFLCRGLAVACSSRIAPAAVVENSGQWSRSDHGQMLNLAVWPPREGGVLFGYLPFSSPADAWLDALTIAYGLWGSACCGGAGVLRAGGACAERVGAGDPGPRCGSFATSGHGRCAWSLSGGIFIQERGGQVLGLRGLRVT